jgi:hypothetical protein
MTTSKKKTKNTTKVPTKKPRVGTRRATVALSQPGRPQRAVRANKPASANDGGNKTAKILALLKRPDGVTLKELVEMTGWRANSVRGFLSGSIGKKMGTPVESFKSSEGDRSYRLSGE